MTQILDLCQPVGSKGISLIEASAGTGKTYSISNIFLHFILKGQKVDEILVVTFTEDATKELNERVRANLSDALACLGESDELSDLSKILSLYNQDESHQRIEHALANFDQASIFTIHSFCQRMLKENAFESHCLFDMELLKDDSAIINEVIEDFIRLKTYTSSALLDLKILEFKNFQRAIEKVSELPTSDLSSEKIIAELELLRSSENKLQEQREDFLEPLMQVRSEALKQVYQMGFEDELRALLADQKGKKYQEEMDKSLSGLKDGLAKFPNSYKMKVQVFASSKLKGQTHELFAQCQTLIDAYADIKQFDEDLKDLRGQIQESNNDLIRVLKVEFAEYFHASYQDKKDQINVLTFNDLIEKLHDALEQEASDGPLHSIIRRKFKVALVDEFQDTDPQQYKIFKNLFGDAQHSQEHAFYMIGDPKQSIYRFRGADIFAYLQAKKDAQYSFTLKDNYRSETGMVDAVNHFFDSKGEQEAFAFAPTEDKPGICFEAVNAKANKSPFISSGSQASLQLQWIQPNEEDPQAELKSSEMEKLVPNIVAQEIVNLLNDSSKGNAYFKDGDQSKALQAGDIAILVNKHRQARSIQEVLIAAKVPAIIAKSGNIFDSDEALSIEAFLSAIFEPKDQKLTPLLLSNFSIFLPKKLKL